jgi:Mn2+/Fe2+ NRAMP family transporter
MAEQTHEATAIADEARMLAEAEAAGGWARWRTYIRLSGPGWLQSAITLGGGSLTGSLYIGVIGGYGLLWVQPLAMVLGIIMLSAIGYVTLSTGQKPFGAVNQHVSPVLGWAWALATLAANIVWCMPQFALATAVLQQNLFPDTLGEASPMGDFAGKLTISVTVLVLTVLVTWAYGSGHWGIKAYEILIKLMVACIVICFAAVAISLTIAGSLPWGEVLGGFIPNPSVLFEPAATFTPLLANIPAEAAGYWRELIVSRQFDNVATAAATAVGINMTFLFPYSLLRKRWGKLHRNLTIFDLATGMFIPFLLATSFVVIAAANRFHTEPVPGLAEPLPADSTQADANGKERTEYRKALAKRLGTPYPTTGTQAEMAAAMAQLDSRIDELPLAERRLAATLIERDANRLAGALAPLTGSSIANIVFGVGVLGMALSTITVLMLMSGFALTEMLGLPNEGWPFKWCCLASAVGALGPFFWSKAAFALAVPTSVFGLIVLPIAYITFALMMNSRNLMGSAMPKGTARVVWNVLLCLAASIATMSSLYMIYLKLKPYF